MFAKEKMINRENGDLTLSEHLNNDLGISEEHNVLSIMDKHHIEDINEEAIDFFASEFSKVEHLRFVDIYYELNVPNNDENSNVLLIQEFINKYNDYNLEDVLSVLGFANIHLSKHENGKKEQSEQKERVKISNISLDKNRRIERMLKFANTVRDYSNGRVEIRFRPYNSINLRPPFHGRYWLSHEAGYIVDGSLNTFSKGMIFAQLMDNENYRIISNIFNNYVRPNNDNHILTSENVDNIKRDLSEWIHNHL